MREIGIVPCDPFFLEETNAAPVRFEAADYERRLRLLAEMAVAEGLSHVVVYADREHFANIDYLIGFEPRFEEALMILDREGTCTLLTGNECMPYSHVSPIALRRVLYQNFSLQGQPRGESKRLKAILESAGIGKGSKVGLIGYKYFLAETIDGDPVHTFDVPNYIVGDLCALAGDANVVNFTHALTGMPDGIRLAVRTAKEVAWAEAAACKTANVVLRMLKNLRPGIGELELSEKGRLDFSPISVFPMANFGCKHGMIGLRSPDNRTLNMGEPCGVCYAVRGALTSRVGLAAEGEDTLQPEYRGAIDSLYRPFWSAIAAWYESIGIGVKAGDVYDAVMGIIGGPEFGVSLNPGHYIGGDEWVNSPFAKGSEIRLEHPAHLQCDIIAGSGSPVMTAICEDGVIVADAELRAAVAAEYPDVWARIAGRQRMMRTALGIGIRDDVLPLSNLAGVLFPYMLDCGRIFARI